MTVLVLLHVLAAIVWVGGMFFAHQMLRPSAAPLDPPVRLALWRRVFNRFFPWVWVCVAVLLTTGLVMIVVGFGGFDMAGVYITTMMSIGIVMMLLFGHLYFAPWRRFQRALDAGDLPAAGRNLDQIRRIVTINLVLGLVTAAVGASGRYW
ncbi:MAG: CopD family protein [Candidatus Eiseniibacteriota bacterium]